MVKCFPSFHCDGQNLLFLISSGQKSYNIKKRSIDLITFINLFNILKIVLKHLLVIFR